eukprot:gnl/MRDRNA2_/MRDRNA2_161480_c0_seq1.p1 gnl/MRDRNA2_/MRDRNA2_161480_c0~~gnl/MRDRNA2_/MRDRNA2_161480_c0_seq1.p1  ORF type:complete len:693 (+),score=113.19 gnl/MRDRNA2_/MRDRNA2_161480_c0_seq1:148-2079(+)
MPLFTKARVPDEEAVKIFFKEYFEEEPLFFYRSLVDLEDCSWLENLEFGDGCSGLVTSEIQIAVAFLRYLRHIGLDRDWVHPAFAFMHKHMRGVGRCETRIMLDFFTSLERLAAYLLFAIPRVDRHVGRKKQGPLFQWPGMASLLREPEDVQLEKAHMAQHRTYRELLLKIYREDIQSVLDWMKLSVDEMQFFRDSFPQEFVEQHHGKRATYAMLRAEHTPDVTRKKMVDILVKKLPAELRVSDHGEEALSLSRGVGPSKQRLAQPLRYGNLRLEYVIPWHAPRQTSDWFTKKLGWTKDLHEELRGCCGNLTVVAKRLPLGQDWTEKQEGYDENQPLLLTKKLAEQNILFTPDFCRKKCAELLSRLSTSWDLAKVHGLFWHSKVRKEPARVGRICNLTAGAQGSIGNRWQREATPRNRSLSPTSQASSARSWNVQSVPVHNSEELSSANIQKISRYLKNVGGTALMTSVGGLFKVKQHVLKKYFHCEDPFVLLHGNERQSKETLSPEKIYEIEMYLSEQPGATAEKHTVGSKFQVKQHILRKYFAVDSGWVYTWNGTHSNGSWAAPQRWAQQDAEEKLRKRKDRFEAEEDVEEMQRRRKRQARFETCSEVKAANKVPEQFAINEDAEEIAKRHERQKRFGGFR